MVTTKKEGESRIQRTKALLLRYSDFQGYDTIEEHKAVIHSFGYCWFGKFGKKISSKYLSQFMGDSTSCMVFLYTAGVLHKGQMNAVSYERPINGYPVYYDDFLYKKEDFIPQVFLRLTSIESVALDTLEQYVVVSSGKPILYDLKKTISSFIIIQDRDDWVPPVKKRRVVKEKPVQRVNPVNTNSCVYRKGGSCTNRRCINFSYECDRPSSCAKQKLE